MSKVLPFKINNQEVLIFGGSCHRPQMKAHIYVSLDEEQPVYDWEQPWNKNTGERIHLRLPIEDMFIPEKEKEFAEAIKYTSAQLLLNKVVHVGCYGGKGRTGMFLSALVKHNMPDLENPIEYVRTNYREESVETIPQVIFLHINYNCEIPEKDKEEVNLFLNYLDKEYGIFIDELKENKGHLVQYYDIFKDVEITMMEQRNEKKLERFNGMRKN